MQKDAIIPSVNFGPKGKEGRKGRIYSLLMMYNGVFYILDGDLLNSALLV